MLKFQARKWAAIHVASDVIATALAWLLAYLLRFHADPVGWIIPVTKGVPDLSRYLLLLPFMALLWPVVLYFHGLYQPRRGRSRIDELFAILTSVLVASALTLGATLYVRVYHRFQPDVAPLWEYSQAVFAIFVALDVVLLALGRAAVRAWQERRWAAGENLVRVLVAGTGDLGRSVADALLAHRRLGYRVVGFLGDREEVPGHPGLPVVGRVEEAREAIERTGADQLYVALPLDEHDRLVGLVRDLSNECVDIKVVPDVVQYATIKAALEDLDGIPIISLNEVPLAGWNSMVKRTMDVAVSGLLLLLLTLVVPVLPVLALLVRLLGGKGPVLLRQERMTLDGRTFQIYKFRTMVDEAEKDTGPVFATPDDPRRTPIGAWLRRHNLDELPQLLNVLLGDMSLVGPRPERPPFVRQFRERIPRYMRRHRVKSGMTGWAQVNGWRGNTSIEKRIEFDLYYIENWSLLLDLKILILTLFRGFGQDHAY
jgi:Undecaprenyl-phosphate glucose phosphotransferase